LPGAATAIGLVAALVLIIQAASADIASIHSQLNITDELLRQKLAQRQELTENIAELEKEIAKAQTSRDNFTLALATLERQTREVNGNLEVVLSNLPPTVSLGSISQSEGTLTIRGRASREEEILSYLKKLDASGRFSQINIAGLRSEGGETDFTLTLGSREEPDGEVSGSLGVVISSLPSAVSLESITQSDGTLTINGWAPGEEEVLSYLKNLDASGKFSEITITSLKRIEGKGMDFTLTLSRGGES
jgi:Tfp pilus assembly protein PilN